MFSPHLGVGVESSFRAKQGDYAGLKYKPNFYDFNAVWHPFTTVHRVVPELQAGLGGVNTKFYYTQQYCDQFAGCSSSNDPAQRPVSITNPPPQRDSPATFGAPPGDLVQSPGSYIPSPGGPLPPGY